MPLIVQNRYSKEQKFLEEWIDQYVIGSEGGSAWYWNKEGQCIGFCGKTRQEAVQKVLEHIWKGESDVGFYGCWLSNKYEAGVEV